MQINIYQDLIHFIKSSKGKIHLSDLGYSISILTSNVDLNKFQDFFLKQMPNYDLYLVKVGCSHIEITFELYERSDMVHIKVYIVPRNPKKHICEYIMSSLRQRFFEKSFTFTHAIFIEQQAQIANIFFRDNREHLMNDEHGTEWLIINNANKIDYFITIDKRDFTSKCCFSHSLQDKQYSLQTLFLVVGTTKPESLRNTRCEILFVDKEKLLKSSRKHFAIKKLKKNKTFCLAVQKYKKSLWKPNGHFCKKSFNSSLILL